MSQLPRGHQYIGRCGSRAQLRYLRRATERIVPSLGDGARLEAWLANEPATPARITELKRLIVLNMARHIAEQRGVAFDIAFPGVLDRLEREQTAVLPAISQYGFLKHQAELMTI